MGKQSKQSKPKPQRDPSKGRQENPKRQKPAEKKHGK